MKYLLPFLFCAISLTAIAQKGQISGKVANENFEGVKGVKIIITQLGRQVDATYTNSDGIYITKPLDTGLCTVRSSYPMYNNIIVAKVPVKAHKTSDLTFQIIPYKKGDKPFIEDYSFYHPYEPSKPVDSVKYKHALEMKNGHL